VSAPGTPPDLGAGVHRILTGQGDRVAPHGDGHPVLVLPGLGGGDMSTIVLRRALRRLGYRVHGWRLGVNLGPSTAVVDGIPERVAELNRSYGRKVSLVGWSLGGIYAHHVARSQPELIRQVITLGSPLYLTHPAQTRATLLYARYRDRHVPPHLLPPPEAHQPPLPMPATSIVSVLDGIVAWRVCLHAPGGQRENIGVLSSHIGLGQHPAVLWAVADRLAQPEGNWRPFRAPTSLRPLFPAHTARPRAA
jgi:pimeloyl-ACP methyl ester carboxylesterase